MEQNKPKRKVLGSEALGELLGRMKDGTFKDIINDWKWIAAYTRRYRAAVIIYTLLGDAQRIVRARFRCCKQIYH